MELKLSNTSSTTNSADSLLIVPYGIETRFNETFMSSSYLLIVPYGIETHSDLTSRSEYPHF